MAYEPKTWQCGEVVTANDLNRIEQGVAEASEGGGGTGSGLFVIHEDSVTGVLDKTWQEIHDAVEQGKLAYILMDTGDVALSTSVVTYIAVETEESDIYVVQTGDVWYTTTANENYPVRQS